jgi:hypothetical protein
MSTSTILDAGIHYNVPASVYHSDPCLTPSLSSGAARTILEKSLAAAHREHARLGGKRKATTEAMSTGSIVHSLLADNPQDFEVGVFDNFRSKAAQSWRDLVIAAGKNAVLECDLDEARKIAASVRANVCNGGITNDPFAAHGKSEVTVIWKEGEAYCRALLDRLVIDPNGYADIWDWKCTNDVTDRSILRSVVKYGYHIQEAFYRRGLSVALPSHAGRISWTFVFVLDVEPYTVRRVCLTPEFLSAGKSEVNRAIAIWRNALATNEWPDGSHDTLMLDAPGYLLSDDEITASEAA